MAAFFLKGPPRKPLTREENIANGRAAFRAKEANDAYAREEEALRKKIEAEHGVVFEADYDGGYYVDAQTIQGAFDFERFTADDWIEYRNDQAMVRMMLERSTVLSMFIDWPDITPKEPVKVTRWKRVP